MNTANATQPAFTSSGAGALSAADTRAGTQTSVSRVIEIMPPLSQVANGPSRVPQVSRSARPRIPANRSSSGRSVSTNDRASS